MIYLPNTTMNYIDIIKGLQILSENDTSVKVTAEQGMVLAQCKRNSMSQLQSIQLHNLAWSWWNEDEVTEQWVYFTYN